MGSVDLFGCDVIRKCVCGQPGGRGGDVARCGVPLLIAVGMRG